MKNLPSPLPALYFLKKYYYILVVRMFCIIPILKNKGTICQSNDVPEDGAFGTSVTHTDLHLGDISWWVAAGTCQDVLHGCYFHLNKYLF